MNKEDIILLIIVIIVGFIGIIANMCYVLNWILSI